MRLGRSAGTTVAGATLLAASLALALGRDGASPAAAAGAAGGALEFRAAQQSAARTGLIAGTAGPQTIEAWIYTRTVGFSMILVNSNDIVGWILEMDPSGYIKFWAADTAGNWWPAPGWGATVKPNSWTHVATTYDG